MRTARSSPYGGSLSGGEETEIPWKEHGTRQPDRKWYHIETPLPRGQNDRHACENNTFPQASFAGGKSVMEWEGGDICADVAWNIQEFQK